VSRHLGTQAEDQAAAHLERLGYRIVARNVTARGGELDLVAVEDGTLCFVEVRSRGRSDYGSGEETVGPTKRRRLVLAAQQFLMRWRDPGMPCRFDVVAIGPDGIRLIKNAFDVSTS
jgi:putative endonuclease